MLDTSARLLRLLTLFQSRRDWTGAELADRLGITPRTVRRDVDRLRDLGYPVHAQPGAAGGYRLGAGTALPPLLLDDDEAVAVALGLVAGQRTGLVVGDAAAAEGALAKIRRVLPAPLSRRLDALVSTADYSSAGRSGRPPDTAVLLTLAEATRARRTVVLDYTSWDGRTGERALDCYGLVFHSGRWYVTGHDHGRGEVRTFRIDRISRITSTGEGYAAPTGFDAVEQVVTGIAAVPWTHQVVVTLHAPPEQVKARLPASVGRLSEVPGGVRLEARAERLDGMALLLAGLGWPFTVEEPDALRSDVGALADRLRADAARRPTGASP